MQKMQLPPEAETIKDLNNVGSTICLIFGILFLVIGIITLIVLVGVIFIIFAIINFVIRTNLKEINRLIDQGEYRRAKEKELIWMILGFILGGIIIGIILLIAYIKYDDLIRHASTN
jgi:hypothetical protein